MKISGYDWVSFFGGGSLCTVLCKSINGSQVVTRGKDETGKYFAGNMYLCWKYVHLRDIPTSAGT